MGGAFSSNSAFLSEGIDINVSESCSGRAEQIIKGNRVTIGEADCKNNFIAGQNVMW